MQEEYIVRNLKLFLTWVLVVISLCSSGCFGHSYPHMLEGDYILEKTDGFQEESTKGELYNFISNVRLELRKIDKQAYDKAKKVNVVSDFTREPDDSYFSFNVYLFDIELNEYRHVDFLYKSNTNNGPHAPTYYFDAVDQEENYNIGSIIFCPSYRSLRVSFSIGDKACYYSISLWSTQSDIM